MIEIEEVRKKEGLRMIERKRKRIPGPEKST